MGNLTLTESNCLTHSLFLSLALQYISKAEANSLKEKVEKDYVRLCEALELREMEFATLLKVLSFSLSLPHFFLSFSLSLPFFPSLSLFL